MAYRVPTLARVLDLSERTVWALIKSGDLESVKVGTARLVTRAAIERYLSNLGSGGMGTHPPSGPETPTPPPGPGRDPADPQSAARAA